MLKFVATYSFKSEFSTFKYLPSVVASGRLEVEEAFLDADTFGVLDEAVLVVTVSDLGEVNIDLN